LEACYRRDRDPVERTCWQCLWFLAGGMTATAMARVTGYSAYWIGQIARRYNRAGPNGVRDRRSRWRRCRPLLPDEQHVELCAVLAGPHPAGDRWCGRTVAGWIRTHLRRRVSWRTGWRSLRQLGARWRKPRPRHARADPIAQAEFKVRLRPLLRQVATAFPHAAVELWAMDSRDEHRIGLKPILQKVWTCDRQRPLAPVEHWFAWRYLVGFVHPASGRTTFHLASTVSVRLFEIEMEAFAQEGGAGTEKQIVLVLDQADGHRGMRARGSTCRSMCICCSCPPIRLNCRWLSIFGH
jgi:transposase